MSLRGIRAPKGVFSLSAVDREGSLLTVRIVRSDLLVIAMVCASILERLVAIRWARFPGKRPV